jgi:hypothetical protein
VFVLHCTPPSTSSGVQPVPMGTFRPLSTTPSSPSRSDVCASRSFELVTFWQHSAPDEPPPPGAVVVVVLVAVVLVLEVVGFGVVVGVTVVVGLVDVDVVDVVVGLVLVDVVDVDVGLVDVGVVLVLVVLVDVVDVHGVLVVVVLVEVVGQGVDELVTVTVLVQQLQGVELELVQFGFGSADTALRSARATTSVLENMVA